MQFSRGYSSLQHLTTPRYRGVCGWGSVGGGQGGSRRKRKDFFLRATVVFSRVFGQPGARPDGLTAPTTASAYLTSPVDGGHLRVVPKGRADRPLIWPTLYARARAKPETMAVGRVNATRRASRPLAERSVVVAARGPGTCAAAGASGERQPGRDARAVCAN